MATQALRPEIELVVDDTTTSNVISHSNHEPTSLMVAKRSLTSLNSILTKFHAGYFRISLSLGGQALWWKTLIESPTHDVTSALRRLLCTLPSSAFLALWMVKADFLHPVRVNYLFAPWISWLLLLQSAPFVAPKTPTYLVMWWVFAVPVVVLDVKFYGQVVHESEEAFYRR
ncbi:S-type anion channel SLAH1 [Glycine soja]|uniref:S-type anion channel SLAH1 n=1 Tax=Glycine soja TaxID=3848 RepID=A0A445K3U6_GLYSO|nr:S-type anion channel SLAH1 [Glycine soja]